MNGGKTNADTHSQDEPPLEDAWRAFIGEKNQDYYLDKFSAIHNAGWRREAFGALAGLSRHVVLAALPKDVDVGSGLLEPGAADQSTCTSPRKSGAGQFRSFVSIRF